MKLSIALTLVCLLGSASSAHAQLGSLSDRLKQAQKAKDEVDKKTAEIRISDADERKLGEDVSVKLRQEFGVYQDKEVTKYVSLVGKVLAQSSSRPYLDWQFVVLDTDGVNAFASPGGIVHVTRGLLGPGQERGGACRRPRTRNHACHREAHGSCDSEEQGRLR